jgi:hypothetical protein
VIEKVVKNSMAERLMEVANNDLVASNVKQITNTMENQFSLNPSDKNQS